MTSRSSAPLLVVLVQSLAENTLLPQGYSHCVAETSTPGVYLGVWVQGPDGAQDLYYRFFAR